MSAPSLYADLLAAGCDVDSHESDLYVRATPEALAILARHGSRGKVFTSEIDGQSWIDVPFAFDPFWRKVAQRAGGTSALTQVRTSNGSPDLFRDEHGRAYWSDGSRVLVRDMERDDADEHSAGLLRDCLREFGLTALGHGGGEVRP